jgi:hypothetical protein
LGTTLTNQNFIQDEKKRRQLGGKRIFGPDRDEVTGGWTELHNEELLGLYSSSDIIKMIRSRGMRWVGRVAFMREMRSSYKILNI